MAPDPETPGADSALDRTPDDLPSSAAWARVRAWATGGSLSRAVALEGVVFFVVYMAYRLGQGLVSDQYLEAEENAWSLIAWEQQLGLYFELAWQQSMLETGLLMELFNWYYENMHFPVTLLALVWVFVQHHSEYRSVRNMWLLFTASAFVVQWLWPLMPPRLMPELGFIDISSTRPGGIYSEDALGPLTNQIAAMPSVHFGWALFAALAVWAVRPKASSLIAFLHPAATFVAIVVTANHWVLDAVFAVPMLAAAYYVTRSPRFDGMWTRLRQGRDPARTLPAVDKRVTAFLRRHLSDFRRVAWISLAVFVVGTALSWNWFDVDEFANLQQAAWVQEHEATLYEDVASHHPPLYTVTVLALAWLLPGSALFWARMASMFMAWGAGILAGHMFLRTGHRSAAVTFVLLWSVNVYVVLAGTRAMNEVPVLFLVTLAAWIYTHPTLPDGRAGLLTGLVLAVSFLTRFTTVFFAPAFLLFQRQRLGWAVASGASTLALAASMAAIIDPDILRQFWAQTVVFQTGRSQMGAFFTVGQIILGSGLIVYGAIYRFVPQLRPRRSPWTAGAAVALGSLLLMSLLPFIAPHYFLPFMPVLTALAAVALVQKDVSVAGRQFVAAAILLTGIVLSGIYLYATPHDNLEEAQEAAAWVELNTPEDMPVLTDAPEYALLAERVNWEGYFWNQRFTVPAAALNASVEYVSVVIASPRIEKGEAWPDGFQATLDQMPCRTIGPATIYWTGQAGPSPFGDAPCPPPKDAPTLRNW